MKLNSQMKLGVLFRQCVGVDISKDKFTACLYMFDRAADVGCHTASVDFANTRQGFNQLVRWSRKEAQRGYPLTYLMEPTGVYYESLAHHLHKIGQTVYVVLPNKARKFCEAEGIKTKTDAMDARCLALMGCVSRKLCPWSPPEPIYRELRQLTRFRADLCKVRTSMENRKEALQHMVGVCSDVLGGCDKLTREIDKLLNQNEKTIALKLAENKDLMTKVNRVATIKGVGWTTVVSIVAETEGFHLIKNRKQLASFAGLDVIARQSGKEDPKHGISKKGNANIRAALYMPALSATRCNRQMKDTYNRICLKHPKEKMIGLVAVMRKLLLLIYTLWNNGEQYDPAKGQTDTTSEAESGEYSQQMTQEPDWNAVNQDGEPVSRQ